MVNIIRAKGGAWIHEPRWLQRWALHHAHSLLCTSAAASVVLLKLLTAPSNTRPRIHHELQEFSWLLCVLSTLLCFWRGAGWQSPGVGHGGHRVHIPGLRGCTAIAGLPLARLEMLTTDTTFARSYVTGLQIHIMLAL